ncbi:hypothetical protein GOBAR_AA08775 [Gossypium barbadense]|uniref:Uncharacterized protein n=1 Tax=Gossypium barbadense TaxID=3634 RepID=A0A2P5Y8E0_GOSBA|nr:hypothetical protein GOBAR_AA08775 [Gossypium barbadense]
MGIQCKMPFAGAGAPPSSYQGELQRPKISFSDHDLNVATENRLSVFEMLINDESEVGSERSLVHEAHLKESPEDKWITSK